MKLALVSICLLSIISWISVAEAQMPNFFQQGKDMFKNAMGGDSNPFVAGAQQMMDVFDGDKWQEQIHDEFNKWMATAPAAAMQSMEEMKTNMEKMMAAGEPKDKVKEYMEKMTKQMSQVKPS